MSYCTLREKKKHDWKIPGEAKEQIRSGKKRRQILQWEAILFPGKTELLSLAGDNKNGMKKNVNRAEIVEFACIWENSQGFKVNRQFSVG